MKTVDCDQVFDVLTRGPFPTGESSDFAVERHLACCHECRSLAEALRPAIELFHETIEPEAGRDLPGYHGGLEPLSSPGLVQTIAAAIEADIMTATSCARKVAPAKQAWWEVLAQGPYRHVAAVACGALLALGLWSLGTPTGANWGTGDRSVARYSPSDAGLIHLASLNLSQTCFPSGEASHARHCCTECHVAKPSAEPSKSRLLPVMVSSCLACHAP